MGGEGRIVTGDSTAEKTVREGEGREEGESIDLLSRSVN